MNLGWVDYSKEEKDTIQELLKMLGEVNSLDELGVGVVRDSISDLLYPGTSVLHTRAKYYILIPELFEMAKRNDLTTSSDVRNFINDYQDKIAKGLKNSNNGKEEYGIIGGRNHSVKIKPTRIYWNALRVTRILCDEKLSFDDACSRVAVYNKKTQNITYKAEDEKRGADDYNGEIPYFTLFNTPCKQRIEDFLKNPTLSLTKDEAQYLNDQFLVAPIMKGTLISYCLENNYSFKGVSFANILNSDIPNELRNIINLAVEFADFIYGAYIVYNIAFLNNGGKDATEEEKNKLQAEYEEWKKVTKGLPNREKILSLVSGHDHYKSVLNCFLNEFESAVKKNSSNICSEEEKNIIRSREKSCKRSKAKLDNMNYSYQRVHQRRMTYRHEIAQNIIFDILVGKGGN